MDDMIWLNCFRLGLDQYGSDSDDDDNDSNDVSKRFERQRQTIGAESEDSEKVTQ